MLLITFSVAGERYAIDVARVVEVVPRVAPRPVPHAPEHLAGYLGYRGQVVPVIDLGVLLGGGPSPDRLDTRIILVRTSAADGERRGTAAAVAIEGPGLGASEPAPGEDAANDGAVNRGALLGLIAGRAGDLVRVTDEQVADAPMRLEHAPYLDRIASVDDGHLPLISVPKLAAALCLLNVG